MKVTYALGCIADKPSSCKSKNYHVATSFHSPWRYYLATRPLTRSQNDPGIEIVYQKEPVIAWAMKSFKKSWVFLFPLGGLFLEIILNYTNQSKLHIIIIIRKPFLVIKEWFRVLKQCGQHVLKFIVFNAVRSSLALWIPSVCRQSSCKEVRSRHPEPKLSLVLLEILSLSWTLSLNYVNVLLHFRSNKVYCRFVWTWHFQCD